MIHPTRMVERYGAPNLDGLSEFIIIFPIHPIPGPSVPYEAYSLVAWMHSGAHLYRYCIAIGPSPQNSVPAAHCSMQYLVQPLGPDSPAMAATAQTLEGLGSFRLGRWAEQGLVIICYSSKSGVRNLDPIINYTERQDPNTLIIESSFIKVISGHFYTQDEMGELCWDPLTGRAPFKLPAPNCSLHLHIPQKLKFVPPTEDPTARTQKSDHRAHVHGSHRNFRNRI